LSVPRARHARIAGAAGAIEIAYAIPDHPVAIAVVGHPHPLFGGTMDNKVVTTVARAFLDAGAAAFRFNFRGVGASEGAYADGVGETEDALAVAAWAQRRYPGSALWLAGFSFGAAVAIRVAVASPCRQLISVAPPVARMAGLLGDAAPPCPWLLVQGMADEVVSAADVEAWARGRTSPLDLVLLPDVDHFFHGRLTLLRDTIISRVARPGVQ
jgi:alpha/beta superfamily hydrolase